jgi:hypothetical protein
VCGTRSVTGRLVACVPTGSRTRDPDIACFDFVRRARADEQCRARHLIRKSPGWLRKAPVGCQCPLPGRSLGGSIDGLDQLTKTSAVAKDLTRTKAHIQ